jgi:hypothetical protein
MKKLIFIFLLFVAIVFASCSKKSSPPPGQENTTFDIKYPLVIGANATQNTPATVSLSGVLSSANQGYANNVVASSLSRAQSYISFTGITAAGGTLSNISFSTSDKGINTGVLQDAYGKPLVLTADTTLTADTYTTILLNIGNYLASKKNITLTATCTAGSTSILSGIIDLHISTTFSWQ